MSAVSFAGSPTAALTQVAAAGALGRLLGHSDSRKQTRVIWHSAMALVAYVAAQFFGADCNIRGDAVERVNAPSPGNGNP